MPDAPRVVILANGEMPHAEIVRAELHPSDRVIAANGGSRHGLTLGVVPDLLIGDRDSLPTSVMTWLTDNDVPSRRFPVGKDATDLELAIDIAVEEGAGSLLLVGVAGKRIDHTLVNFALLAQAPQRRVPMQALVGRQCVTTVWDYHEVRGTAGDLVSLVPWGGNAHGVRTTGLQWELTGEMMAFAGSRGISNELIAPTASIQVDKGILLVIHERTST